VSDRIRLAVAGSQKLEDAVRIHHEGIGGETLALEVETGVNAMTVLEHVQEFEIEGENATVALSRIDAVLKDA
jgi:hypothetical protein